MLQLKSIAVYTSGFVKLPFKYYEHIITIKLQLNYSWVTLSKSSLQPFDFKDVIVLLMHFSKVQEDCLREGEIFLNYFNAVLLPNIYHLSHEMLPP